VRAGWATIIVALVLPLCLSCTPAQMRAASDAMQGISKGASWLGAALEVADSGASAFFSRHPNAEREAEVSQALHRARLAHEALEGLIAAADSLDDPRLEHVRSRALAAYGALRALLESLGVLDATAPDGGAESEAPLPLPFALPTQDEIAARL
jgi:hypothetical protein